MSQQVVRTRNVVTFGGAILKGLATAVVGGSIVLGGVLYTDRSQVSEACSAYGTGSYLCYDDVVLTATGGLPGYTSGSWQCGTASCSILRLEVQSEASAAGAKIDVGIVSSLTSSGQNIVNSVTTASGETIVRSTGSYLVPPSHYVKAVYTSNPNSVIAQMRIWYNKFYTP